MEGLLGLGVIVSGLGAIMLGLLGLGATVLGLLGLGAIVGQLTSWQHMSVGSGTIVQVVGTSGTRGHLLRDFIVYSFRNRGGMVGWHSHEFLQFERNWHFLSDSRISTEISIKLISKYLTEISRKIIDTMSWQIL